MLGRPTSPASHHGRTSASCSTKPLFSRRHQAHVGVFTLVCSLQHCHKTIERLAYCDAPCVRSPRRRLFVRGGAAAERAASRVKPEGPKRACVLWLRGSRVLWRTRRARGCAGARDCLVHARCRCQRDFGSGRAQQICSRSARVRQHQHVRTHQPAGRAGTAERMCDVHTLVCPTKEAGACAPQNPTSMLHHSVP